MSYPKPEADSSLTLKRISLAARLTQLAPKWRLMIVFGALLITAFLFLFINLQGSWAYSLTRRGWMLATMVLVGVAAGIATVMFHTITHNRILTPAVMGFESLYILIQTLMIFLIGSDASWIDARVLRFLAEAGIMLLFAISLYRWLFTSSQDLHRLLLVGIVFGVFFFSLSNLMQRLLDPSEFDVLQGRLFARITLPDPKLIILCTCLLTVIAGFAWRKRYTLDVLALGKTPAVTLGLNHHRNVTTILILVSVLVAISTALIGPLTFLGFLAATIAYQIAGTHQHRILLPMAASLGVLFLLGGQLILERILGMAGVLTVVIEFIGGAIFLTILLRKRQL